MREFGQVPQLHALLSSGKGAQDRSKEILRATLTLLRALRRRPFFAQGRKLLASQFVAAETRQVDVVLRIVARVGRVLDVLYDAPASAMFHRADADQVHLWLIDRAVGLLDQKAVDPAPAEISCQGQADRSGSDHEDTDAGGIGRHRDPERLAP